MTGLHIVPDDGDQLPTRITSLTHHSSLREKAFEHVFLGDLCVELLDRGMEYEVLHGETDRDGYDLIIEAGGIPRHIQLKVTINGGARVDVTASMRLARKPSACVIWLVWDPAIRGFSQIRYFGAAPGQTIPDLGERPVKHSRGNATGEKAVRPEHRTLPMKWFEPVRDIAALADRLFGSFPTDAR